MQRLRVFQPLIAFAITALLVSAVWFLSFPVRISFQWQDALVQLLHLMAALVCLVFMLRVQRVEVTWGWSAYCLALMLDLFDEFTETPDLVMVVPSALEIGGLLLCALGFFRAYGRMLLQMDHLRALKDQIDYVAHHDPLTGLPNRALSLDRLEQALDRSRRHRSVLAVLFVDIDDFKTINEQFGHAEGDRLIQQAARRLEAILRQTDSVSRWGGDEFVLVASELEGERGAVEFANRVAEAIEQPFQLDEGTHRVRASIGIALSPQHSEDPDELLRYADTAMYWAKSEEGMPIRVFSVSSLEEQTA